MSKKPDTASALAGILKARRTEESSIEVPNSPPVPVVIETPAPPSPAPLEPPSLPQPMPLPVRRKARNGKSSDKANYSQCSIYIRKDTRKKVGRALDDEDKGQDFSELVQELLLQWLNSRT